MRGLRTDLGANLGWEGGIDKRKKLAAQLRKIHVSGEKVLSTHFRSAWTAGVSAISGEHTK